MVIGGLQKFSVLDYPEHLAAIIFTQGCNFRCQFCYNPMLVRPIGEFTDTLSHNEGEQKGHSFIKEDDLFDFLKSRAGKLDAVVVTGGEPTIHKDLPRFFKKIKTLSYKIKLDTNGTNPEMLEKLIKEKLIDYIAMDLKADFKNYEKITGVVPNLEKLKKSITMIKEGNLPYEFRITVVPGLHKKTDIREVGKLVKGAKKLFIQQFQANKELINKKLEKVKPYTKKELRDFCAIARAYTDECEVR